MAEQRGSRERSSSTATKPRRSGLGPARAVHAACDALQELIGHPAEGASSVERGEDGWTVLVDVLEVARIPDTTSLLATYEVRLGPDGDLTGYRRTRRYRRGAADE